MENEQINTILEKEELSASQLAERLGVQRAMISHLLSNRNRVSLDMVKKIHHAFPHINLQWLIDGDGDYSNSDITNEHHTTAPSNMGNLFSDEEVVPPSTDNYPSDRSSKLAGNGAENEKNSPRIAKVTDFSKENEAKIVSESPNEPVKQDFSTIQKTSRKIVEIMVFYDDGTYESLSAKH